MKATESFVGRNVLGWDLMTLLNICFTLYLSMFFKNFYLLEKGGVCHESFYISAQAQLAAEFQFFSAFGRRSSARLWRALSPVTVGDASEASTINRSRALGIRMLSKLAAPPSQDPGCPASCSPSASSAADPPDFDPIGHTYLIILCRLHA